MKIILLGAPGSGKGTQASLIEEKYSLLHVSTGDIFRDNIKRGTPIGLKIKEIIDGGDLAPDELTVGIVKERLQREDCSSGYLLDGFPRNIYQAKALDEIDPPCLVLNISIPSEKLVRRLTGRRSCATCKNSFHIDKIGDSKICPTCGGELYIRKDDNIESVKERFLVYKSQTEPLIEYYTKQGKLVNIDGDKDVLSVFEDIKKVLG
jgi:adenylate kinase